MDLRLLVNSAIIHVHPWSHAQRGSGLICVTAKVGSSSGLSLLKEEVDIHNIVT